LSQEPHELVYNLLDNLGCRGTKENQKILKTILSDFKKDKGCQHGADYDRSEFYQYAKEHSLYRKLEKSLSGQQARGQSIFLNGKK
jgi:hypothetical protein